MLKQDGGSTVISVDFAVSCKAETVPAATDDLGSTHFTHMTDSAQLPPCERVCVGAVVILCGWGAPRGPAGGRPTSEIQSTKGEAAVDHVAARGSGFCQRFLHPSPNSFYEYSDSVRICVCAHMCAHVYLLFCKFTVCRGGLMLDTVGNKTGRREVFFFIK